MSFFSCSWLFLLPYDTGNTITSTSSSSTSSISLYAVILILYLKKFNCFCPFFFIIFYKSNTKVANFRIMLHVFCDYVCKTTKN